MTKAPKSMSMRNTKHRYGTIAMSLHWIVAALFFGLYVSVYYRHWFTEYKTPENWTALQLHLSFGITVMAFVFLRVLYKLWDKSPEEEPGTKLEHLAAKAGHLALYAVMIAMPLTGYFGTGVNTEFYQLFVIPQFSETTIFNAVVVNGLGLTWEQFEPPMDFIHKNGGAYVVWALIGLHVCAALYHHYWRKDNTIRRMLPIKLKP